MKKVYFFLYRDEKLPWVKWLMKQNGISAYSHAVIGLDREFREAYGFRIVGGSKVQREPVAKYPKHGRCFICSKEVTDEQYDRLKAYLRSELGKRYRYDFFGTFFLSLVVSPLYRKFGIRTPRWIMRKVFVKPHRRTCGSFIGLALESAGIKLSGRPIPELPGTISPYLVNTYMLTRTDVLDLSFEFEGTVEEMLTEWMGCGTLETAEVRFQYSSC